MSLGDVSSFLRENTMKSTFLTTAYAEHSPWTKVNKFLKYFGPQVLHDILINNT